MPHPKDLLFTVFFLLFFFLFMVNGLSSADINQSLSKMARCALKAKENGQIAVSSLSIVPLS